MVDAQRERRTASLKERRRVKQRIGSQLLSDLCQDALMVEFVVIVAMTINVVAGLLR